MFFHHLPFICLSFTIFKNNNLFFIISKKKS